MKNKAVFLDRDGVLNQAIVREGKPFPPRNLSELVIFPDVLNALNILKKNGFFLIVVTNQPDVARGSATRESVEEINLIFKNQLPLDAICVCYHDDKEGCDCRKPLPGLLLQAARDFKINLKKSFMIGDRWRDIEAGKNANCQTIWINRNYSEKAPISPHFVTHSLSDAVNWIIHI